MILPDSSVWIDHYRITLSAMLGLLDEERVVGHPLVTAEVALGSISRRAETLRMLDRLDQLPVVFVGELRWLIENERLFSRGLGFVDLSLLASCRLAGARLWTRDQRLATVAAEQGVGWPVEG